jgi:hypothetical protein
MMRITGGLALALAALAATATSSVAGGWLRGQAAPASVKRALTVRLADSTAQERSLAGSVMPARAIVGASLDAKRYVWAAPTDTGWYCMGMTRLRAVADGDGCSSASGGSWSSFTDCDGAIITGGRVGSPARATARALEIRGGGTTVRVAIDPSHHGFFIARLNPALFATAAPHERGTWPRTAVVDARGHVIAPARDNVGRLPPPDHVIC